MLKVGDPEYRKPNVASHLSEINKIYLYAMGPFEAKYQLLNNKRESIGLKGFNDSRAFIEYSNDMNDIYKNIEESKVKIKKTQYIDRI